MGFQATLSRDSLLRELAILQSVVDDKSTMAILSNFQMTAEEGRVALFATNLEVGYRCAVVAENVSSGAITLEARKTHDIIREMALGATIAIEQVEEGWAVMRSGAAQFRMATLPAENYPPIPKYGASSAYRVNASVFHEMITKTLYATSTDETRRTLTGVLFVPRGQELLMISTDGHRLCHVKRHCLSEEGHFGPAIIPRRALTEVRRLLEDLSKGGEVEFRVEEKQIVVEKEGSTFFSRLIEGAFPDFEEVIPAKSTFSIRVRREDCVHALRRVSILASERTHPIVFAIEEGRLTIRSNSPELGEAREVLETPYRGEAMEIGFNARYISEALGAMKDEEVEFSSNEPLAATVVRGTEDPDYTCVVMPMRLG